MFQAIRRCRSTALRPYKGLAVLALVSTAMVLLPLATARAQANAETGVDTSIHPGDDFFAYANGDWLKSTPVPAGKARWSAFNEIGERNRQRLSQLRADAANAPAGSSARKVADFRAAYLNEAAIEARGIAPIQAMLDQVDRIRDKGALTQHLGSRMRADVDPLNAGIYRSAQVLGLAVQASIHGEKAQIAFLVQGGLGLPEREHYLSAEARMQALRAQY